MEKLCPICKKKVKDSQQKYCNIICYNMSHAVKRSIKLKEGKLIRTCTIRQALIEKYGNKCSECGQLPLWNNKPLLLHVDHIDGNSDNNKEINVRLLCPNCHSQTITFSNKEKIKKFNKRNIYRHKNK
jgi:Zn finger protein HypA/HybF involved in hydrogenase expression